MQLSHSIRIPVHGFVPYSDWERDIINHSVFQRLRRIRQLAFSDHLYPGSTHTRFEHSLGVMHVATLLYDTLANRYQALLEDRLGYNPVNSRARVLVRLAALLHDVGHSAFSHTGEHLMPDGLRHEDYSAELIRHELRDVIEEHPDNQKHFNIRATDIADFYQGRTTVSPELLFWKEIVAGQLDADRMDYLLRDGLHCGVDYGRFDLGRIVDTLMIVEDTREESPAGLRMGLSEGGVHAAEGLIIARYFMFTQVYFHPVRKAYDHHAAQCVSEALRGRRIQETRLPDPRSRNGRSRFLKMDDWETMRFIKAGKAGRHGGAILAHHHDRCVYKTPEVPTPSDIARCAEIEAILREKRLDVWVGDAEKEWYTTKAEVRIGRSMRSSVVAPQATPLSEVSDVVARIPESKQRLLFVPADRVSEAQSHVRERGGDHD